ncbi:MAG: RHS repeat protein [Nitrospira sp.]|nr:RHS repeat protein [Nitrospira sp.]
MASLRTYNSQGQLNDGDGDGWRWNGERKVVLSGTRNTTGSTLTRTDGDGSVTVYQWNGTRYVGTDGNGAHDSLSFQAAAGNVPEQWLWTDGSGQWTERYSVATGRLASQTDTSGNQISFEYDGSGRLSSVIDVGSGQKLVLTYAPAVAGSS